MGSITPIAIHAHIVAATDPFYNDANVAIMTYQYAIATMCPQPRTQHTFDILNLTGNSRAESLLLCFDEVLEREFPLLVDGHGHAIPKDRSLPLLARTATTNDVHFKWLVQCPRDIIAWYDAEKEEDDPFGDFRRHVPLQQRKACSTLWGFCRGHGLEWASLAFESAAENLGPWCSLATWGHVLKILKTRDMRTALTSAHASDQEIERLNAIADSLGEMPQVSKHLFRNKLKRLIEVLQSCYGNVLSASVVVFVEHEVHACVLQEMVRQFGQEFGLISVRSSVLTGRRTRRMNFGPHQEQTEREMRVLNEFAQGGRRLLFTTGAYDDFVLKKVKCDVLIRFDTHADIPNHVRSRAVNHNKAYEAVIICPSNDPAPVPLVLPVPPVDPASAFTRALGNAFLKLSVSLYLFVQDFSLGPGRITISKDGMICNAALISNTEDIRGSKASIGQAYQKNGLEHVLAKVASLVPCLKSVHAWEDFARQYELTKSLSESPVLFPNALLFEDTRAIEVTIGYSFEDVSLLSQALNLTSPQFQRLELIGDCALDILAFEHWSSLYPHKPAEQLNLLMRHITTNKFLAIVATELRFHRHILGRKKQIEMMGHGATAIDTSFAAVPEMNLTNRLKGLNIPKDFGDLVEAIFGAVYTDSGFQMGAIASVFEHCVKPVIDKHIQP
ncbi:Dicer-like protein 1 [Gamsiella multidivaricata]|nr:Dicer-like protein 1 [Gamsiella multidivaricata]